MMLFCQFVTTQHLGKKTLCENLRQTIFIVTVAGVRIRYNDANEIYAWKDGELYTLEQAYVAGIPSRANIRSICDIHNQH